MELLDPSRKKADNESVGTPSSTFEHGLN
jgi:hypothetical protein